MVVLTVVDMTWAYSLFYCKLCSMTRVKPQGLWAVSSKYMALAEHQFTTIFLVCWWKCLVQIICGIYHRFKNFDDTIKNKTYWSVIFQPPCLYVFENDTWLDSISMECCVVGTFWKKFSISRNKLTAFYAIHDSLVVMLAFLIFINVTKMSLFQPVLFYNVSVL